MGGSTQNRNVDQAEISAGNRAPERAGLADAFVGRDLELAAIERFLGQALAEPCPVVVRGSTGIGKTRLLREVLGLAPGLGFGCAHGACYPEAEATPYGPIVQILSRLGSAETLSAGALQGRSPARPGAAQELRARRARALRSSAQKIAALATTNPLLLCIEDLHWADPGSLLLINHILDAHAPRLAIVCSLRSDEPMSNDARVLVSRIEQRSHIIELRGLSKPETGELARRLLGRGRLSARDLTALHAFTRGNPLFLREVVRHLSQTGLLDQRSLLDALLIARMPDGLLRTISTRLALLPDDARNALAAAAAIGLEFNAHSVATALGDEDDVIEAALEKAAEQGVVQRPAELASSLYAFSHPMYAKALYDALSSTRRRGIHRAIADAAHSGAISLPIADVARHHAFGSLARHKRRTISYCRAAAEEAEKILAYESAARFWELALSCASDDRALAADFARRLGRAQAAAGKWSRAVEAWTRAVSLFDEGGNTEAVGELALTIGELQRWQKDLVPAAEWLERALAILPDGSPGRTRAIALMGSIRSLDEPLLARGLLAEALRGIQTEGGDPGAAFWLSQGLAVVGDIEAAYEVTKQGIRAAQEQDMPQIAALLAGNLVISDLSRARADRLDEYLGLVERGILDATDTGAVIRSLLCKALVDGYRGRWPEVLKLCEGWMGEVRLASRYQVATAMTLAAEAQAALGDRAGAAETLLQALPDLGEMRPLAALHLARILVGLGELREAGRLTLEHADSIFSSGRVGAARILLGDVAASLEVPDLLQRSYELIREERRPMVVCYCATSVQRVLGRLAGRLKRWHEAIQHFELALTQLSAGGAHWEYAQTLGDFADMRRRRRRRADERKALVLEQRAAAVFGRLDITPPTPGQASAQLIPYDLSGREIEVLVLAAEGRRNKEIADELSLSERTIERHIENIFAKLSVESRIEAVVKAVEAGIVRTRTDSAD